MIRTYVAPVFFEDGSLNHEAILDRIRDEISEENAPFCPELLYDQVLDIAIPEHRDIIDRAADSWVRTTTGYPDPYGARRVVIESPFSGDVEANIAYAQAALKENLLAGRAPIASHLVYTQVLDDDLEHERMLGIHAGFAWNSAADEVNFYTDNGFSSGMNYGLEAAKKNGTLVVMKTIDNWDNSPENPRSSYHAPVLSRAKIIGKSGSHRVTYGSCGVAHRTQNASNDCYKCN